MAEDQAIRRIAAGTLRVDSGGRSETVYVAGSIEDRWAFWNGHVFRSRQTRETSEARPTVTKTHGVQLLAAPMPAKVTRILITAGTHVGKGDTLLVLEAMKMELPMRALSDGTVKNVRCREGDLVTADQTLVELD